MGRHGNDILLSASGCEIEESLLIHQVPEVLTERRRVGDNERAVLSSSDRAFECCVVELRQFSLSHSATAPESSTGPDAVYQLPMAFGR